MKEQNNSENKRKLEIAKKAKRAGLSCYLSIFFFFIFLGRPLS
jgi:hypothetical protein